MPKRLRPLPHSGRTATTRFKFDLLHFRHARLLRSTYLQSTPQHYRKDLADKFFSALDVSNPLCYVRVVGQRGVGQSTAIAAALAGRTVVRVDVPRNKSHSEIVAEGLAQVAENPYTAVEVADRHKYWFNVPPMIVVEVRSPSASLTPREVSNAARELSELLGFGVVVDCSYDTVEPKADRSRAKFIHCTRATKSMIESDAEFAPFVSAAKAAGVADVFWAVIGGTPREWSACVNVAKDPENVVESDLEAAWTELLQPALVDARRDLKDFCDEFGGAVGGDKLAEDALAVVKELSESDVVRLNDRWAPYPNNVIHCDDWTVRPHCIPATPAMRFALRAASDPEYSTNPFATLDDARAFVASIPHADARVDGGGEWSDETAAAQPVNEKTSA